MVGGLNRSAEDSEPVAFATRDAADSPLQFKGRRGPDAGSLKGFLY